MPESQSTPFAHGIESVWIEPPAFRPPTLALRWAPPPMLVQRVPPRPFAQAVWIGGYWHWQLGWLWAQGMWSAVPRQGLQWVHPSYEHRDGLVLFVAGHWSDPQADAARAAEPSMRERLAVMACTGSRSSWGAVASGPDGSFVPAPPGSHPGIIVPAPRGTAPAVMSSVPPLSEPQARVTGATVSAEGAIFHRVTAPAGSTVGGRGLDLRLPSEAHLAAALPPVVPAWAPRPRSELSLRYVDTRREEPHPAAVDLAARSARRNAVRQASA